MDGKTLLLKLRQVLNEDADGAFLDDYTSYGFLNEAAIELVRLARCLEGEQEITTVADTAAYSLEADFLEMYLTDKSKDFFVKYYDGTNYTFIRFDEYASVVRRNSTASQSVPSFFTIRPKSVVSSQVSGTASTAGTATAGKCTLTTATSLSVVSVGDYVHNTTDGSSGVVLSAGSSTAACALFGGTGNDWTASDSFVIQPQGRLELVLDPAPESSGHTVTVHYLKRPAPVYSDYGVFGFQSHWMMPLVYYAAWLYKYRDRDPNYGDKWFVFWDRAVRMAANSTNNALNRSKMSVSFKKPKRYG